HRKDAAVLAPGFEFPADADNAFFPRPQVTGQIAAMLIPIRRRHEYRHILADHLGGGVAKHPLGGGIDGLEDGAETFFAIAQRLLGALGLADVAPDHRAAHDVAATVAEG